MRDEIQFAFSDTLPGDIPIPNGLHLYLQAGYLAALSCNQPPKLAGVALYHQQFLMLPRKREILDILQQQARL